MLSYLHSLHSPVNPQFANSILFNCNFPPDLAPPSLPSKQGARVDVEDKERNTALHLAAQHGHASVIKTLVSSKAVITK